MPIPSRFRSIICISAIFLLHLAIVTMLNFNRSQPQAGQTKVSTLWIVAETKLPPPTARSKPTSRLPRKAQNLSGTPAPIAVEADKPSETITISNQDSAPRLDLDALRAEAVQHEMTRKKSAIELAQKTRNHSFEAQVEAATNKAQHSDCRSAYAGAGLFAPLVIAADLIRDKGCQF
ncbi:hypothetical protein AAKU67_002408 [Oxalobacteraceae bacterium GrIS 2.11]